MMVTEIPMDIIKTLEQEEIARLSEGKTYPEFRAGDTVSVVVNVIEGTHKRTQAYEGIVICKRNRGLNTSFVVRKIYYLRSRSGKAARIRELLAKKTQAEA